MEAIITQARINSSRLPNKIFLEAGCKSFFKHHIERLKPVGIPVIVATTDDGSEKPIIDFCEANDLLYFRGSEKNVLKRFYECALQNKLDTIIRVTSDCPLIDGHIIKNGFEKYKSFANKNIYYSNALKRTYPRGMDYEIFSFQLLKDSFLNATEMSDKEHVTPYIWKNRSGDVVIVDDLYKENNSDLRITLDTEEDKKLISELIEDYAAHKILCYDIVKILRENPILIEINKVIEQKKV